MNIKNYEKAMLIIMYIELGENNSKMFCEICSHEKAKELGFPNRTEYENKKFIRKWFKEHNVKMKDFKTLVDRKNADFFKYDKNGIPVIVERKVRSVA